MCSGLKKKVQMSVVTSAAITAVARELADKAYMILHQNFRITDTGKYRGNLGALDEMSTINY